MTSPPRGYKFGCICSYVADIAQVRGCKFGCVCSYMTGIAQVWAYKFGCVWSVLFRPAQTGLCKFGWLWSSLTVSRKSAWKTFAWWTFRPRKNKQISPLPPEVPNSPQTPSRPLPAFPPPPGICNQKPIPPPRRLGLPLPPPRAEKNIKYPKRPPSLVQKSEIGEECRLFGACAINSEIFISGNGGWYSRKREGSYGGFCPQLHSHNRNNPSIT